MFENSILVTAKMQMPGQTVIRRCLVERDKPVFADLIEAMEKLFGNGVKVCPASFYYVGSNEERVTFSSDEELKIAFYLTEREMKIGLEELQTSPEGPSLKVENPSSDSSANCSSLNDSSSQHSTPTEDPTLHPRNTSVDRRTGQNHATTSTPTLYRSKILPKLTKQWPFDHSYNCTMCGTTVTEGGADDNVGRVYIKERSECISDGINSFCAEDDIQCRIDDGRNSNTARFMLRPVDVINEISHTKGADGKPCSALIKYGDGSDRAGIFRLLRHILERLWDWVFPVIGKAIQ